MKAVARKPTSKDTFTRGRFGVKHTPVQRTKSVPVFPSSDKFIQHKLNCPCDSGCPRCEKVIQPKLTLGLPNERYEQEAGELADKVIRMPTPDIRLKPT